MPQPTTWIETTLPQLQGGYALLGFAARWLHVLRSMKFEQDLKYLYDKGEQKDTMTTNANLEVLCLENEITCS